MSIKELQGDFHDLVTNAGINATKKQSKEVLDAFWDQVVQTTIRDGRLAIRGFGIFKVEVKPARKGRNPSTGAAIQIAERTVFRFKSSVEL